MVVKAEPTEVFQAIGAIVGKVILIGPTCNDIVTSHAANKSWKVNMVEHPHFGSENQKRMLREGKEAYNYSLLNMNSTTVETHICGIQPRDTYFHGVVAPRKRNVNEDAWVRETYLEIDNHIGRDLDDKPAFLTSSVNSTQPQIFLGSDFFDDVAPLGLLPGVGGEGDLICLFWKTNVAALIRKEEDTEINRITGSLTGRLSELE